MSTNFHFALLPGDGIGPDVCYEALKVLRALEAKMPEISFTWEEFSVGANEFLRSGDAMPPATFAEFSRFSAILLGAMGLPNVRYANGREITPQIDIREKLDLYCGIRPIELFHPEDSPLKGKTAIDFIILRENTEGLFSSRLQEYTLTGDEVCDRMRITRAGSERVIRAAFFLARQRRKKVTLVDKANVLPSMVFFRHIFDQVAKEFPEVETERTYVDAMALYLVQQPERFDVIVTENMFGDILSDLAAGLVGGMGMAPSADVGDRCAVYQPSHGTAPDIAGKGIANPVATILSAAMMLESSEAEAVRQGAARIRAAVAKVMADPKFRTPDMGGKVTTTAMGDKIAEAL